MPRCARVRSDWGARKKKWEHAQRTRRRWKSVGQTPNTLGWVGTGVLPNSVQYAQHFGGNEASIVPRPRIIKFR